MIKLTLLILQWGNLHITAAKRTEKGNKNRIVNYIYKPKTQTEIRIRI